MRHKVQRCASHIIRTKYNAVHHTLYGTKYNAVHHTLYGTKYNSVHHTHYGTMYNAVHNLSLFCHPSLSLSRFLFRRLLLLQSPFTPLHSLSLLIHLLLHLQYLPSLASFIFIHESLHSLQLPPLSVLSTPDTPEFCLVNYTYVMIKYIKRSIPSQ